MKIYRVEELVPILRVLKKAVRAYIASGRLRGRKVGKRWLVTEEALRLFLNSPDASLTGLPESGYIGPLGS